MPGCFSSVCFPPKKKLICSSSTGKSLYDRLGGAAAITATVNLFYDKVLADDRIRSFFTHTNMEMQRRRQIKLITLVTGGPPDETPYDLSLLRSTHLHMNITDFHFDATVELLIAALKDLKVQSKEIDDLCTILSRVRPDIIAGYTERQAIAASNKTNLYQTLGEFNAVSALVDILYAKILNDPRISHLFSNKIIDRIKQKQTQFLSTALGSGQSYEGPDMKTVHSNLKISHFHFDAVNENLKKSMDQLNIGKSYQDIILIVIESLRKDIVASN
jgi:truncated hemoglobin YjbI